MPQYTLLGLQTTIATTDSHQIWRWQSNKRVQSQTTHRVCVLMFRDSSQSPHLAQNADPSKEITKVVACQSNQSTRFLQCNWQSYKSSTNSVKIETIKKIENFSKMTQRNLQKNTKASSVLWQLLYVKHSNCSIATKNWYDSVDRNQELNIS